MSVLILATLGLGAIEDISARRQAEVLVTERGKTVLTGIAERLQDRQRAKQIFAQLLADQPGLADAVAEQDAQRLAQLLVPLMLKLGLGFVEVESSDGRPLQRLGEMDWGVVSPLARGALAGLSSSQAGVTSKGLAVWGAAPIKGSRGIEGGLVVGAVLGGAALNDIKDRDAVEIAMFRDGELIDTTIENPDIRRLISGSSVRSSDLADLNATLDRFDFAAVMRPLDSDTLMALVPTGDLRFASDQRRQITIIGTGIFGLMLLILCIAAARRIARSLDGVVETTRALVRGEVPPDSPPSRIREISQLGRAIDHLARQLQVQREMLRRQHEELADLQARREVDRRTGEFVGIASHEFRTPLTALLGFSEMLLATDDLSSKHRQWVDCMHAEAQRMARLVEDLLDVARIQDGRLSLQCETVQLRELLASVQKRCQGGALDHTIDLNLPPHLEPVFGDPDKLIQIVINLVSNAIKYSPDNPLITINAESGKDMVHVSVTDQGLGIPAEDLPRLFERFHRIDERNRAGIRGTGLGLYITRKLVELQGGRIWAESPGPGKGSTFHLELPIARAEVAHV